MTATSKNTTSGTRRLISIGLTFIAGLTLGVLAVFVIQTLIPQNEHTFQDIAQRGDSQSSSISPDGGSTVDLNEIGQIQDILNQPSVFDQQKVLYSTLSSATAKDLKDLWIQSQKIERKSQRETVQDAVIRKLTMINPQEALRCIEDVSVFQAEELLRSVFSEWSVSELDDAIEGATTLSRPRSKVALQAILETRDDLSDRKRRSIAERLEGEETYHKLVSEAMASSSIATPKESWDILLNDDVDDYLQMESLAIVLEAWRKQSGFRVLSDVYHAEIEEYQIKLQLMRTIARVDLAGALDYTQGLVAENERLDLSRLIVLEWASTDAQAALSAIETVEPPSFASQLESNIAFTWAYSKPSEVIENIELLSDEFRLDTLESAFAHIANQDPLVAIAKVSSVVNVVGNVSSLVESIVDEWSRNDPKTATDWVVQNYTLDDPQRRELLEEVLPRLAHQDPSLAIELAIEQPTTETGLGLELDVIRELARAGEVDTAKKMLPRVKANTKLFAYQEVGAALMRQAQTREALDLRNDFDEAEQELYYHHVLYTWADANPKNLFQSLEDLPTSSIKSRAAMALIVTNQYEPLLTDSQIQRARDLLNSDDEALLKRIENR